MSRSYRKTPIVRDNRYGRKKDKRLANKTVRNYNEVPNGKMFRKFFNPWNIYDYKNRCSLEEFISDCEPDEVEAYKIFWKKTYFFK